MFLCPKKICLQNAKQRQESSVNFHSNIIKGVLYFGCPPDPVEAGEHWCSTKVDKDGNHITGGGFYGLCKTECPRHQPNKRFRGM